jgi:hypothetical protein
MATFYVGNSDTYVGRDHVGWAAVAILALTCAYADAQPAPITEESEITYRFPDGEAPPAADVITPVWADEWQLPPEPTGYRIVAAITPPAGGPPLIAVIPDPDPEPEIDESFVASIPPEAAAAPDEGLLIAVGNDADPLNETEDSFVGHLVEAIYEPTPYVITDEHPEPETDESVTLAPFDEPPSQGWVLQLVTDDELEPTTEESHFLSEIAEIFDPVPTLVTDDEPGPVTEESEYSRPFEEPDSQGWILQLATDPEPEPETEDSFIGWQPQDFIDALVAAYADSEPAPATLDTEILYLFEDAPVGQLAIIEQSVVSEEAPEPSTEDSFTYSDISEVFDPVPTLVTDDAPEPATDESEIGYTFEAPQEPAIIQAVISDDEPGSETEESFVGWQPQDFIDALDASYADLEPQPATEESATVYTFEDAPAGTAAIIEGVWADEYEPEPEIIYFSHVARATPLAPTTAASTFVVTHDEEPDKSADDYLGLIYEEPPAAPQDAPIVGYYPDADDEPVTDESFIGESFELGIDVLFAAYADFEPAAATIESEFTGLFETPVVVAEALIVGTLVDADEEPQTEDSFVGETFQVVETLTLIAAYADSELAPATIDSEVVNVFDEPSVPDLTFVASWQDDYFILPDDESDFGFYLSLDIIPAPVVPPEPPIPPVVPPAGGDIVRPGGRAVLLFDDEEDQVTAEFDYISSIRRGTTIVAQVVTCEVYTGVDSTPGVVLVGLPVVNGLVVTQILKGGVQGTIYKVLCRVTTINESIVEMSAYYTPPKPRTS